MYDPSQIIFDTKYTPQRQFTDGDFKGSQFFISLYNLHFSWNISQIQANH